MCHSGARAGRAARAENRYESKRWSGVCHRSSSAGIARFLLASRPPPKQKTPPGVGSQTGFCPFPGKAREGRNGDWLAWPGTQSLGVKNVRLAPFGAGRCSNLSSFDCSFDFRFGS
jgi:hypothetical protein